MIYNFHYVKYKILNIRHFINWKHILILAESDWKMISW